MKNILLSASLFCCLSGHDAQESLLVKGRSCKKILWNEVGRQYWEQDKNLSGAAFKFHKIIFIFIFIF